MSYVTLLFLVVVLTTSESCLGQTNRNRQQDYNGRNVRNDRLIDAYKQPNNYDPIRPVQKRQDLLVPLNNNQQYSSNRVVFPRDVTITTTATPVYNNRKVMSNEIPLSLFKKLSQLNTSIAFQDNFIQAIPRVGGMTDIQARRNNAQVLGSTLGRDSMSSVPFADPAVCTPQPTTVPIELSKEPYVLYFPSCTRLDRCGGCCSHELLECAPTKRENVTLQVFKTRYLGPGINKFDVAEPVYVKLERHLECECQCRVKPSDCHLYQVYRPNECRCECLNEDEAVTCVGDKFWDSSTCTCGCREDLECSTGLFFNRKTCMCELGRVSRMGVRPSFRDFNDEK